MFVLLPVFAFILKLLYLRGGVLYIQHIIHSIHIHAFAYLIYGLALAPILLIEDQDVLGPLIALLAIVLVTLYCFKSFRYVYGQKKVKTLVKFTLVGILYGFTLMIGVLAEIAISLLIY